MKYFNVLIIALGIIFSSVAQTAQTPINASVIYEVNVRQYTPEGTFNAFAKHLDKKHKAVQGYKRLNAHALRQIKSGGILITFSCSQVIDKSLFNHTIISAAIESNRKVKILYQLHQPADHPIGAFHPEGEYLKGLVVYVE